MEAGSEAADKGSDKDRSGVKTGLDLTFSDSGLILGLILVRLCFLAATVTSIRVYAAKRKRKIRARNRTFNRIIQTPRSSSSDRCSSCHWQNYTDWGIDMTGDFRLDTKVTTKKRVNPVKLIAETQEESSKAQRLICVCWISGIDVDSYEKEEAIAVSFLERPRPYAGSGTSGSHVRIVDRAAFLYSIEASRPCWLPDTEL